MPSDWNLGVLCPVFKKSDPTICASYRGISLINIAYKVITNILCERLKPSVNKLIGPYQCGFRPNKSTIDQIITVRQILKKTHEMQMVTQHLFVDFNAALGNTINNHLYNVMFEFGIRAKLIRLCRMALSNCASTVKIGKDFSDSFILKRDFRQGGSLSCYFFNLLLEKVIHTAGVKCGGTIFYKSVMLLVYVDDIDIIGLNMRAVSAAFSSLDRKACPVDLAVNEDKTKYLLSTSKVFRRLGHHVDIGSYNFEVVKDFVYLETSISISSDVSLEILRINSCQSMLL